MNYFKVNFSLTVHIRFYYKFLKPNFGKNGLKYKKNAYRGGGTGTVYLFHMKLPPHANYILLCANMVEIDCHYCTLHKVNCIIS